MAIFVSLIYLHAAVALAEPAAASAQSPASKPVAPAAAAPAASVLAPAVPAEKGAKTAAGELASRPWRYQWHNDHWWYYTPQNTWLVYMDDGWHPYAEPRPTYAPRSYRSYSTQKRVDPGHSLDTTGNYPRYWLWQRLGN